jgi:hypothetical protein
MFVKPRRTAFLLLFMSVVVGGACDFSSHPTDNEMEELFKSNQSDLETLVTMLGEDKDIVRLDEKFVFLMEGSSRAVPQARLTSYRNLFVKLRLERGFQRDKDNALRFIASSKGILSSSEKSYIYSTTPLTPLVDSLDAVIERDHGDQKPVYKKLHGSWYIYYASW